MNMEISEEAKRALANRQLVIARGRLRNDGCSSDAAFQRRVLLLAAERNLPPAEYAESLTSHRSIRTQRAMFCTLRQCCMLVGIAGNAMRAICAIVLMLLATSAYAQELTVICKYERSVDDGKISGTSGEMSVNVLFMLPIGTPNNLKIKTTKAPCYEFVGDGDDMKIRGVCLRYLGNGTAPKMKMLTTLKIDRVSGAFEQIVQFNDKGGLTHMGHCTPATRMF